MVWMEVAPASVQSESKMEQSSPTLLICLLSILSTFVTVKQTQNHLLNVLKISLNYDYMIQHMLLTVLNFPDHHYCFHRQKHRTFFTT